jgi:alanine racemase
VDTNVLRENVKNIRNYIGNDIKFMSILKADAYGMGLEKVSKVLEPFSDWFGVATFEEALRIREQKIETPILVLGYVRDENIQTACDLDITLCTISVDDVKRINLIIPEGKQIDVHLKIDTGLNRIGLYSIEHNLNDYMRQIKEIYDLDKINITGIYTHFASAGSFAEEDVKFTQHQYDTFIDVCNKAESLGYDLGIKHICNSNAMVHNRDMYLDMVRVGKFLFGYGQNKEIAILGINLAFNLKARIVNLKTIQIGESVGYDREFVAKKPTKIATIGFGYADGYRKNQSKDTEVLINRERVKIAGNIAMDYFMADVSNIQEVKVGDYATIIGKDDKEKIMPNEIASIINASTPEFNSQVGNRVRRVYI